MVFTLYMVIALIFIDIVRLCIPNFAPFVAKYGFSIAAGFVLLILAYGYYNYKNPKINKINIIADKNASHDIIKIVAVSDVHLGNGTGKKQLGKYVELIYGTNTAVKRYSCNASLWNNIRIWHNDYRQG